MKKSVRFFKQNSSMETCICCCILMLLDFYRKLPGKDYPTRSMETELYKIWGSKLDRYEAFSHMERRFVAGTPLSAAACCLAERGLQVKIVHSCKKLLDNSGRYYPEELFPYVMKQYEQYINRCSDKIENITGEDIDCGRLAKELEDGWLLILMCIVDGAEGDTLHGVVVDKCRRQDEKRIFHICDPANGRYEISENEV